MIAQEGTGGYAPPVPIGDELADLIRQRAIALGVAGVSVQLDTSGVARTLADRLEAGDRDAAQVVLDLAWPVATPTLEWSGTDLGAAATLYSWPVDEPMPLMRAAAVLGVSRQYVQKLARSGQLARTQDGVAVSAVRALYERRRAER